MLTDAQPSQLHAIHTVRGIADRLLEAVWRESLHMINEGVATTAEIDDAIRFGCGIRFSFMGSFLIYTLAGGDAGMKHFMAQFGPALELPWTKLKAPKLTDELRDHPIFLIPEERRALAETLARLFRIK